MPPKDKAILTPRELTIEPAKKPKRQSQRAASCRFNAWLLAHNGKRGVQRHVSIVSSMSVDLTTTSHATEGIEHAGTKKADKGDNDELDQGRGNPWRLVFADLEGPVTEPSRARVRGKFITHRVMGGVDLLQRLFVGHLGHFLPLRCAGQAVEMNSKMRHDVELCRVRRVK